MQLDPLYKAQVEALGLTVNAENYVMMEIDGIAIPCTVTSDEVTKSLVIPTRDVLRKADWDQVVAMHPLCESATLKESPVLKKLRLLVNMRLNNLTSAILMELMTIAVDTDYHSKLSASAAKFLTHVPDADDKMLKALGKVLQRVSVLGEYRLINLYLKHGGTWGGRDVFRLASVTFPLLDDELGEGSELFGVKMRIKDKAGILNLFRYIYPQADDVGHYSYGSNSMVAPFYHALFKAFAKVTARLNVVINKHGKHFEDKEKLLTDLEWLEEFDDLSVYRDLIPTLNWNDGSYDKGTAPTNNVPVIPAMNAVPFNQPTPVHQPMGQSQQQTQQPHQSHVPVQPKGGAVTWDEVVRQRQQASGYVAPPPPQWNQPQQPPQSASQGLRGQPMRQQWGNQQPQQYQQPQQQQWGRQAPPQQQWGQSQQSPQPQWGQNTYPNGI